MLHQIASAQASASDLQVGGNPADRRAHPRIPSSQLRVDRVRIPHRPSVSLVDLSLGGALLELPFQVPPDTRIGVELHTAVEHVEVPFQLLRCYVAELKGGVKYHAAGAFDGLLNLQALAARASTALQRLIGTLERLLGGQKAAVERSAGEFNEILAEVLIGLRKGESFDLVALKVKARLTRGYPSLSILPTQGPQRDALTTVECFGLTFKSRHAFSAQDRRFLKSAAQLISMLENCRREMGQEEEAPSLAPQIIYSAADWLNARSQPSTARRVATSFRSGVPVLS
jgi:hypothetical protein